PRAVVPRTGDSVCAARSDPYSTIAVTRARSATSGLMPRSIASEPVRSRGYSMVHARAVASICAVLALGGAVLLVPKLFGVPGDRISVSASPIRGEYYFVGADVLDTYPVSPESDK